MTTEDKKLNLAQKIVKIREHVVYMKKEASGFNYKYVSGSQVLSAIRTEMDLLNVLIIPVVINAKTEPIMEKDKKGNDKKSWLTTLNLIIKWQDADTGEQLEVPWYGIAKQDDPARSYGSCLSYMQRYHLLQFLNVPTDELDPDAFTAKAHPELAKIGNDKKKELVTIMSKLGMNADEAKAIAQKHGFKTVTEVQAKEFEAVLKSFKAFKPAKSEQKEGE